MSFNMYGMYCWILIGTSYVLRKEYFFDELCDKLGFDLSRIKMIEIDASINFINDE